MSWQIAPNLTDLETVSAMKDLPWCFEAAREMVKAKNFRSSFLPEMPDSTNSTNQWLTVDRSGEKAES